MRAIITSFLAALAVAVTAGAASAQHGGGHGASVYTGHAPVYYPPAQYYPQAHYSHGGYVAQPGGLGFGVYAGPTYAPAVGIYSGPAVGISPYYSGSGYGTTSGHHRPHHLFPH